MSSELKTRWVIGAYEGDQAKHVIAHADHGIGYFMMEQGGNRVNPACMVAFTVSESQPLGPNMQPVTSEKKLAELDQRYRMRHGIREDIRSLASADVTQDFKSIMGLKNVGSKN